MYTRGGDKGETGLFGGKRVPKESPRVEAYGTIDELSSCIGVAISVCEHEQVAEPLRTVQRLLFVTGADLASELPSDGRREGVSRIGGADTKLLEKMVDELRPKLPRLDRFIFPGGGEPGAQLHLARAVCRRAERRVVMLGKTEKINPELVPFLNRLSTYLFDLARYANQLDGKNEETWKS